MVLVLDQFINSFLNLPSLVIILLVSFVVSLISIVVYKLVTDQQKLKSIQEEQKKLKEEMKKHKDKPEKVMKLQKRAMEISMEMMPQTFKSMMVTFIPIVLIFTWLAGNIAYEPLRPGDVFTSTIVFENDVPGTVGLNASEGIEVVSPSVQEIKDKQVLWELKAGEEGRYTLHYSYGSEFYSNEIVVTSKREYGTPRLEKQKRLLFFFPIGDGIPDDSNIMYISVDLDKARPFGSFNIFGYYPGWLMTYFIFSFAFSIGLRKLLKVY